MKRMAGGVLNDAATASAPVSTASTPGTARAAPVSMLTISAWARSLRRKWACAWPSRFQSAVYRPLPVSSRKSSRRPWLFVLASTEQLSFRSREYSPLPFYSTLASHVRSGVVKLQVKYQRGPKHASKTRPGLAGFIAQSIKRNEIGIAGQFGHRQPPAGPEHARRLAQRGAPVGHLAENRDHQCHIELPSLNGRCAALPAQKATLRRPRLARRCAAIASMPACISNNVS